MPGRVIGEYVRAVQSSGRNARLYLYGLFLCGLGQSIFSLLFNLYLRELGVSDAGIGQILSKISLGAAVAALPVAFLFRRVSSRAILVTAGALTAFTTSPPPETRRAQWIPVWAQRTVSASASRRSLVRKASEHPDSQRNSLIFRGEPWQRRNLRPPRVNRIDPGSFPSRARSGSVVRRWV